MLFFHNFSNGISLSLSLSLSVCLCNDPPPITQYCPFFAPPNQASQEITHPGTTLAETRLIVKF
jgi:hypothetical protein